MIMNSWLFTSIMIIIVVIFADSIVVSGAMVSAIKCLGEIIIACPFELNKWRSIRINIAIIIEFVVFVWMTTMYWQVQGGRVASWTHAATNNYVIDDRRSMDGRWTDGGGELGLSFSGKYFLDIICCCCYYSRDLGMRIERCSSRVCGQIHFLLVSTIIVIEQRKWIKSEYGVWYFQYLLRSSLGLFG